jgi:hypothetical protein
MANSVGTNPIVLDSAGVVQDKGPITIKAIRVVYGADADDVLLSDAAGNPVFVGKATTIATAGNTDGVTVPGGIKVEGLTATTIDSGTVVYLYLK